MLVPNPKERATIAQIYINPWTYSCYFITDLPIVDEKWHILVIFCKYYITYIHI